jgi:hypothetical protein
VLRYGNARELCLGLEVVTAQGEVWDPATKRSPCRHRQTRRIQNIHAARHNRRAGAGVRQHRHRRARNRATVEYGYIEY